MYKEQHSLKKEFLENSSDEVYILGTDYYEEW